MSDCLQNGGNKALTEFLDHKQAHTGLQPEPLLITKGFTFQVLSQWRSF